MNLSLACRYLHWRMFTFCTCYAPYTLAMKIKDGGSDSHSWKHTKIQPKREYLLEMDISRFAALPTNAAEEYYLEQLGLRRLFIYQPTCLRKPFLFKNLKVILKVSQPLKFYLPQPYSCHSMRNLTITSVCHLFCPLGNLPATWSCRSNTSAPSSRTRSSTIRLPMTSLRFSFFFILIVSF